MARKAFALALSMLLIAIPVFAEGVDLASMSTDELVALRESIDAELDMRPDFVDSNIIPGMYVIGEDIKEGKYTFTSNAAKFSGVYLFENIENYNNYIQQPVDGEEDSSFLLFADYNMRQGDACYLDLKAAMVLYLNGNGRLEAASEDWAP